MLGKNTKEGDSNPKDTVQGSGLDSQFQSLIETAIEILAVLNEHGTFRYLSPSVLRAIGYSPEELIGQSAFDHMHEEDVDEQLTFSRPRYLTLIRPLTHSGDELMEEPGL